MLLNEIDALGKRIDAYRELQEIAGECDRFETRAGQLEQVAATLRAPVGAVALLKNSGIDVAVKVSAGGLLATTAEMKQSLATQRSAAVSDTSGFGQKFKKPLEGVCTEIGSAARDAWERHVDATWPTVNREMMNILKKLRGFRESVTKILELDGRKDSHRARLPSSEDDIRQYCDAVRALQDALKSLGSEDLPDHVLRFVRLAGLNGFPLDGLTPEILEWLRSHDLLGQFVVKTA